jgi:hypothetical protein
MRARIALFVAVLVVPAFHQPNAAGPVATGPDTVRADLLWEPPTGARDLYYGPWGARLAPNPAALYTFLRNKHDGVNPGVIVRDPQGREWHVKQAPSGDRGAEGPVEVVVSRVLSAIGYHQPPVYFLPSFTMRTGKSVRTEPGGRFRLNEPSMREIGNWSWDDPIVKGTRPYNGLLVILHAFSSWDLKTSNNFVYAVQRNERQERWYLVRDLGGALGDTGGIRGAKRNNIGEFERKGFITGVSGGYVDFSYGGKQGDLYRHRIPVADARWAIGLLASLDDRQWREAFRAGGYAPAVAGPFISKIKANILQGQRLTAPSQALVREKR